MPQATTRQVTTTDAPINNSAPTLIPGLSADLLTGSGWLLITLQVAATLAELTWTNIHFYLEIDGTVLTDDAGGETNAIVGANTATTLTLYLLTRLGAGQHHINALGYAAPDQAYINDRRAFLNIIELGF